ncbi:MAG TPA: pirin family protein [Kofleriaceae bacterium]|jgi:redox-sensitive bicupin YhaK (pirin superfamily)|nr:pirin family protein [Kofleriaceae bacterium]
MIAVRRSRERGTTSLGWLYSRHSFSFGDYRDPAHMGFRTLRVINEDRVVPGAGFGAHGHQNMEIVSYVLEGALEHKDSTGIGSVVRAGDVQRMTAGRGVMHSEVNASPTAPVHFLQIWIVPDRANLSPSYEQVHVPDEEKRGGFRLVASRDGGAGIVCVHQDVAIYAAMLDVGQTAEIAIAPERHAWVQIARGAVELAGELRKAGDGVAFSGEPLVRVTATKPAEVLVFDLA